MTIKFLLHKEIKEIANAYMAHLVLPDTGAKAFAAHLLLPPDSYRDIKSTHHPTSGQVTI
jgi:hypothetical protein